MPISALSPDQSTGSWLKKTGSFLLHFIVMTGLLVGSFLAAAMPKANLEHTGRPECSKIRPFPDLTNITVPPKTGVSNHNTYSLANNGLPGVYAGMIPCADCEGIQYRLVLNTDSSFQEQLTYKGKSGNPLITKGRYSVQGDTLVRLNKKDRGMALFKKHPKGLLMLDSDGNEITGDLAGHYILVKLTRMPVKPSPATGSGVGQPGDSLSKKRAFLYKKWRSGVGFYGSGNEPSWSVELNFRKFMRFRFPDGSTFITPPSKGAKAADANVTRYYAQTPKGTLTVQIILQECADPMSGEKADFKVTIDVKRTTDANLKHYEGCGNYTPDFRLEGTWTLQNMNGAVPDTVNYPKGLPTLVFSIPENRFSGDAGCNRMMGKFSIRDPGELQFSPAATTLMFCPNMAKEDELLKALKSIDGYSFGKQGAVETTPNSGRAANQLLLKRRGTTLLVFSKG